MITFYISNLVERLKVEFIDVINMIGAILHELDSMKEVTECSFENEEYFYNRYGQMDRRCNF